MACPNHNRTAPSAHVSSSHDLHCSRRRYHLMCILFPVIDSCISCSPCKGRQPLFDPQYHHVLWPVQVPGIASLYLMHNLQDKECVPLCCCMIHTSDTMSSSSTAEAYQL